MKETVFILRRPTLDGRGFEEEEVGVVNPGITTELTKSAIVMELSRGRGRAYSGSQDEAFALKGVAFAEGIPGEAQHICP